MSSVRPGEVCRREYPHGTIDDQRWPSLDWQCFDQWSKNSAVGSIPATLLAGSRSVLENLPQIRDVEIYIDLLTELGAVVSKEGSSLYVDPSQMVNLPLLDEKVQELRASYYLMGALLGRFKEATIGLPGGCNLGPRPIDQHIKGFEALGTHVKEQDGALHLYAPELKGARIYLDVVSVGATINIMLAAVIGPKDRQLSRMRQKSRKLSMWQHYSVLHGCNKSWEQEPM